MKRRLTLLLAALGLPAMALATPNAADTVVAAARASVEAALGAHYTSVDLVETGRPAVAPPGDVSLRAKPVVGRFPRERFTVDVDYLRGGRVVGKGTVSFALHAATTGWVYTQDAHDHDAVASLAMEQRPVDAAHGGSVSPDDIVGMRLKRNVRAGQTVALADFERIPDVDNREPVRLRAAFGEITVESAGLALRAGNKGDVVTVQIDGATAPVKATVVDRGVAELVR